MKTKSEFKIGDHVKILSGRNLKNDCIGKITGVLRDATLSYVYVISINKSDIEGETDLYTIADTKDDIRVLLTEIDIIIGE